MTFADTNYFLRFLLADIAFQHKEAKQLFARGARGEERLFTSVIVFFEVYWVLASFYKKSRAELVELLRSILSLRFLQIEHEQILHQALNLYASEGVDLVDTFHLAFAKAKQAHAFKTFDRHLEKLFNTYRE